MIILDAIALTIAAGANILLSLLVIRRNPQNATNKLFSLLSLSFALWAVATFFAVHASTTQEATFWLRAVMFLAVPQAVLFFLLMHTFPNSTIQIKKRTITLLVGASIVIMGIAASPLVFPRVSLVPGAAPQPEPGIGLIAFIPLAVGSVIGGLFILFKKNIRSHGIEKIQARYLLIGALIMFTLIVFLNFIAVAFLRKTYFANYGPVFTLPFVGLTAYTIIRHRLLDIRAAIFRGLSLSFLVGALLLIYGGILLFAVPIAAEVSGISNNLLAVAAALVSIPLAQYIQAILTRLTDRFLFQGKPDYQHELVVLGQRLSSTIKIEDVTDTVLRAMGQILRVKDLTIFLLDPESHHLTPHATAGKQAVHLRLEQDNPLVDFLHHHEGPLVKDELPGLRERTRSRSVAAHIEQMEHAMQWLDAAVILPLFVNRELTGIRVLRSGCV